MKKVLLVSYYFAPNNAIGAVRPTKIANRLSEMGYEVDVFTYGYSSNDSFHENVKASMVYRINDEKKEQKPYVSGGPQKVSNKLIMCVKKHVRAYNAHKLYKSFFKQFVEVYEKELHKNGYDAVFTTFGPICALQTGLYIKSKYPEINWICDFRDPAVVKLHPFLYKPMYYFLQEKACKKADRIVAVSNGYLNRICKGRYADKAIMIPNGYDLSDKESVDITPNNDILRLAYVGSLYEGKRDLSPIFRSIRELIDEGKVDSQNIVFEYAGTQFFVAEAQAAKYDMTDILHNNGLLERKNCLDLQFSSHALILSTWNEKGEEGVFPGKFLEYMLIGRPIISVVDGNLGNSEVSQVMREGALGVSYESANDKTDFIGLKDYIYTLYTKIVLEGGFEFSPNQEVLERYNYDNIMKRIEALINKDE